MLSVPLNKMTSYIQQLRSFLPEATTFMAKRRESKQDEKVEDLKYQDDEDYVTTFMDTALVTDWDKLSPKVCCIRICTHLG